MRKSLGGPKEHQEFEAFQDDHPLVRLFHNPNGPDVAYDLWAYTILFYCLTGSAHWWIIKNDFGVPVELWVIPTHWMRMETDRDGQPLTWYVQSPWGQVQHVPCEDVVSFWEHSPLNRYEGHAVSQAIDMWVDTYEANVRARLAQYKNGAIPAFHVALGEAYSDPDEAFLARFYAKWFARFQGEDNTGKPIITGADVEVKPLGISPVDMGYDKTEDQIRDMTLAAYGVQKAIIGLTDNMTYGAVKSAKAGFREYAVNPCLNYFGQVITEKIIKPVDPDGCFWWDRRVDDPEFILREIESRRSGYSITPNEERVLFGVEAYEHGGDDPMVNSVPVPWVTGQRDADGKKLDREFDKMLNGDRGSTGGYLLASLEASRLPQEPRTALH